jgi:2-oxoglutarate dehydrogenase E2 component (dihydrolipoamide succinyltransferase)
MPQLGESVIEGTVSRWLKQAGESIEEYESLLEVNTDKVDTEIPSPAGGTLLQILVPEGETVKAGVTLAWIGQPGEEIPGGDEPSAHGAAAEKQQLTPEEQAAVPTPQQGAQPQQPQAAAPTPGRDRDLGFISPVVARMAQEHNLDLQQVTGSGEGGRITKRDVEQYLEQRPAAPAEPQAEAAPWDTPGEGDLFRPTEMMFAQDEKEQPPTRGGVSISHTNMRRQIAEHMARSRRDIPDVTTVMEANLQRVVQHRAANKANFERDGVRLTYTPYFISALVSALQAYPLANSSWNEQGVQLHPQINIGMAVSLGDEGLIVPIIRNANRLSLLGLAQAVQDLAERARTRKLKPDEVQGGTFSVTNHGTAGSLFATPIINPPQAGILGVGLVQKRVVVIDDAIAIRPMVYLSFSFDHRILDGATADAFLAKVVETLESWG